MHRFSRPRSALLPALCALFLALLGGARGAAQEGELPGEEEKEAAPAPVFAGGETRWYRSNSAGMALEFFPSRSAALRNRYSLSIGPLAAGELPEELRPYYTASRRIELRTLFEDGVESRRQYLFIDAAARTRLIAVLTEVQKEEAPAEGEDAGDGGEVSGSKEPAGSKEAAGSRGFIEVFDEARLITEAHQLMDDGSEYATRYIYRDGALIRAETRFLEPGQAGEEGLPVNTDHYRYTRSGSLRLVERVFHRPAGEDEVSHFRFPLLSLRAPVESNFVLPATAYSSEFLEDVILTGAFRVLYNTDDRGRLLGETRYDEAGNVLGEILNTWSGDRLVSVEWISGEDKRRTEYDYNRAGDRIGERNYNKGKLERVVRREGNREVEDLYMNDIPILRAVWEDGRKISEERLRGNPRRDTPGETE